jgi:hypothetical protein
MTFVNLSPVFHTKSDFLNASLNSISFISELINSCSEKLCNIIFLASRQESKYCSSPEFFGILSL